MWRLFRSPRNLVPSPRIASNIQHGQAVNMHRVKFTRPARLRLRNFLVGGAIFYGCYTVYTTAVFLPLRRWVEEEEQNLSAEGRKALEEDLAGASVFLPFPLTTHTVRPPPYSGKDPEWKEFTKLSQDRPMRKKISEELASRVRRSAETSVPLTMRIGKRMTIRRYWMDMDFPLAPPIEYRRSGILWTDDTIEWTAKPVDSSVINAINRVLWPSPVFFGVWAFASTLVGIHMRDVLRRVGYEPKSPPVLPPPIPQGTPTVQGSPSPLTSQQHPDIQRALQRIQQQATKRPEEAKDPRAVASQNQDGAAYGSSAPPSPAGSGTVSPTPAKGAKGDQEPKAELFAGYNAARGMSAEPWKALMQRFAKAWKRVPEQPPRGSVVVSGLVELETQKGFIVIDVVGFWDPKTRKFDEKSMLMRLRRLQMKTQAPMR